MAASDSKPDIKPFTIAVPDEQVELLKQKLALAVLPKTLDPDGWSLGTSREQMARLVGYWRDEYDWRAHETRLNGLPHFTVTVEIEGGGHGPLRMHFVHQRSTAKTAIPLLFVHGWPGSFIEALKIIEPLAAIVPDKPSFHVVVVSLPNFGFSDRVHTRGFGIPQYAEACHKVMMALGYERYVTQGGDWGFFITRAIGRQYPQHCLASHVNMLAVSPPAPWRHPRAFLSSLWIPFSAADRGRLARLRDYFVRGSGYSLEQATKPATIGHALADSPVALLAWLLEKLHDWSDAYPWTPDEILTWVSIYAFSTAGPAASVQIYHEFAIGSGSGGGGGSSGGGGSTSSSGGSGSGGFFAPDGYVPDVLYGVAYMPREVILAPRPWARLLGPVVHESEARAGGHFAAYEKPEWLVEDLRLMFGKTGGAAGIEARVLNK